MTDTEKNSWKSIIKLTIALLPFTYRFVRMCTNLARFLLSIPHEADLRALANLAHPGLILDVGANNGMSALSIRIFNRRSPILSLEANRIHEPELRIVKKILRNFDYRIIGASDCIGSISLHTPYFGPTAITGESSLDRKEPFDINWFRTNVPPMLWGFYSVRSQRVDTIPIDSMNLQPSAVKIDVEGAELLVLQGMRETLQRSRPYVLVERSGGFGLVHEFLAGLGYSAFAFDDFANSFVPLHGDNVLNVFFMPPRLAEETHG